LHIERYWTHEGVHPFDEVSWELRTALIGNERGETIFEQRDVEVPAAWGQLAVNIVVSKYFRGHPGAPDRETSVRQVIERVVNTITGFAASDGLFASTTDEVAFHDELAWLVLHQRMAFNSPVWFNIGHRTNPQSSACFISPVEDSMEGIMALARTEAMLFKGGSGSGSNLSCLRAQGERLSGGGESSGPLSWMRGYDAFAGAIRSGGATRRAAKIVLLDDDHPDVMAFAGAKAHEEDKALALIREGYDSSYTGEAYASVEYQNANLSVRVTDAFMNAVESDSDWQLKGRVDHRLDSKIKAHDLLRKMAEGAWRCGDPGIQFDTTINSWHTCPASGRINASNPCSEFLFVDGSACNLASINLLSFGDSEGTFDVEGFRHAVDLTIIAQESLVDHSSYPAPVFAERSHALRPLGIGYANLGALLMARGLAYDSDAGRAVAATITAIMGGEAYAQSARIAAVRGSFAEFDINREAMMSVIERHNAAAFALDTVDAPGYMRQSAIDVWHEALALGKEHGYRNAQTSLAPPTGTISFMMGCDTTGVEPAVALVSYKKLVGEGYLKMVSGTVSAALHTLGYNAEQTSGIERYIDEHDTIEGAPGLRPEHLPVFDCAIRPQSGSRSISIDGHIKMMAAIQPFLSGAISKTVNLPEDATVDDIERVFVQSWKLGIKAIAVYRDNCKHSQPLSTKRSSGEINESQVGADEVERKIRDLEAALKTTKKKILPQRYPSRYAGVFLPTGPAARTNSASPAPMAT
jgi:ribonucleoside-diphosphate reductase alpha chain